MASTDHNSTSREPVELPRQKLPPFLDLALPGVAIGSSIILTTGLFAIVEGSDFLAYAKFIAIGGMAAVVSYGVNKLAIENGAPLAARRFRGAALASVLSILAVGSGLFAGTYPGLVLPHVAERQLQEHGIALDNYIAAQTASSAQASRIVPALRAIVGDLQEKAACEITSGCVSGSSGGYGTVARVMEELAGRAANIGREVDAGLAARQTHVGTLNALIADYQTALADEDADIRERRSQAQVIDAKIRQELGELSEALPVTLVSAYAGELQSGADIAGRTETTARLDGILARHGDSLNVVAASSAQTLATPPAFPKRTGVSDTFAYIGSFLPIAAVAATVDLIFPVTLWFYTYWQLVWRKHIQLHELELGDNRSTLQPLSPRADRNAPHHGGEPLHPLHHDDGKRPSGRRRANGHAGNNHRTRGSDH